MSLKETIINRYTVVLAVLLLVAVFMIGKIIHIQFTSSEKMSKELKRLESNTYTIQGNRGNICSSDGRVLATSIPYYKIYFDLGAEGVREIFNQNLDKLAGQLSTVFTDKSKAQFKKELTGAYAKKSRYYLVHPRKVDFNELQKIKKFAIFENGRFKGGFMPEQEYVRVMPHGKLAYRTIGLMTKSENTQAVGSTGLSGIENRYENYLRGSDGIMVRQKLSSGTVTLTSVEPENGCDVITTIDIYLQDIVEDALRRQLVLRDAEYGTAILMEVSTGEVKAIANLGRQGDGYQEIYNYALGHEGANEPGSTFKLMTLMAALEEGVVDTSDIFDLEDGKCQIYDQYIYDSDYGHGTHGPTTVKRFFEKSSNVGMAKMITTCFKGRENDFIDRLCSFGLNEPLDLNFKGEAEPYIKHPKDKDWWGTTMAFMAQGYEVKISPLHVLTFYNAVANNGKMMKPMFVKSINDNGREIKSFSPQIVKSSICSHSTLKKAQSLLESVVENGTARNLKNSKYSIAGKTGTAKVLTGGSYAGHRYRASFAGYFPADKPRYSCIVVVAEPKGTFYGSSVAAPVFKQIADRIYASDNSFGSDAKLKTNMFDFILGNGEEFVPDVKNGDAASTKIVCNELGIDTEVEAGDADWMFTEEKKSNLEMHPRLVSPNRMPNVMGMGLSDAVYVIEKAGMKVSTGGLGTVRSQNPRPGTICERGQCVSIELRL